MALPRPVDSTLHGLVDYAAGALLTAVLPSVPGLRGTRAAGQIRAAGAVHLGYSALTRYPLGVAKAIPFKAHLAIDAVAAVSLAATPFVTGQFRRGRREWVPHLALCAFELAALAMTDPTGRGGYHGDVDAVRAANAEDPHRQVHGPPAVRPAAAR